MDKNLLIKGFRARSLLKQKHRPLTGMYTAGEGPPPNLQVGDGFLYTILSFPSQFQNYFPFLRKK